MELIEKFYAIDGIHGSTVVILDSANNLDDAKYIVNNLLEDSYNWIIKSKITNPEKEKRNEFVR